MKRSHIARRVVVVGIVMRVSIGSTAQSTLRRSGVSLVVAVVVVDISVFVAVEVGRKIGSLRAIRVHIVSLVITALSIVRIIVVIVTTSCSSFAIAAITRCRMRSIAISTSISIRLIASVHAALIVHIIASIAAITGIPKRSRIAIARVVAVVIIGVVLRIEPRQIVMR